MWGTFNVREDHLKGLNKGDEFTAYVPAFNKDIMITSPLGRSTRFSTRPTGSGRAATSSMPFAMARMRSSVRARRSSITSLICPFAAAISSALAARIAVMFAGDVYKRQVLLGAGKRHVHYFTKRSTLHLVSQIIKRCIHNFFLPK